LSRVDISTWVELSTEVQMTAYNVFNFQNLNFLAVNGRADPLGNAGTCIVGGCMQNFEKMSI
jgi:hypothetical protein